MNVFNFVIFSVCANKTDENTAFGKPNHHNKPIVVPFDIEHITVIPNIIHIIKHFPYIIQILPIRLAS